MSKKKNRKPAVKAIDEETLLAQNNEQESNSVEEETVDSTLPNEENVEQEIKEEIVDNNVLLDQEVNDEAPIALDEKEEEKAEEFVEEPFDYTSQEEVAVANEEEANAEAELNLEDKEESLPSTDSEESNELGDGTMPPVEEIHEHGPKEKKPLTKKQKKVILITTLSVFLVIAITLSIALPIYFHFKDKVMINEAEDFNNVSKGTYYVLNKDIEVDGNLDLSGLKNYSIDLNNHTLTVNGDLIYGTEDEKTISIGNYKKKEFIEGGILNIKGNLICETPNAKINLLAASQMNSAKFIANEVNITAANSTLDVDITAASSNIVNIQNESGAAKLNIHGGKSTIHGIVGMTLNALNNSKVNVRLGSIVENVTLDNTSFAEIAGSVKAAVSGGKKVAMLPGHSCGEFKDIEILGLYVGGENNWTASNIGNLIYINKLPTPVGFMVEEKKDGSIVAVSSKVPNATKYIFTIDGEEYPSETNELNISDVMKNGGPATHALTVKPIGNYTFESFETLEKSTVYLDGDTADTTFTYKITLETPTNVAVTEKDGVYSLSFDSINFASYYEVTIGEDVFNADAKEGEKQVIDISEHMTNVGTYFVQVRACSSIKEIISSKQSSTSFTKYAKLESVSSLTAKVDAQNNLTVAFIAPENGLSYTIFAKNTTTGETIELARTTRNEYTIKAEKVATFDSIIVKCEAHDYYLESDATIASIELPQ